LNIFRSPLKNYFKYKFVFYFDLENLELSDDKAGLNKIIIQDNIELELEKYCFLHDVSLISWIYTGISTCSPVDKSHYKLSHEVDRKFCWNLHAQNKLDLKKFYGYKFRLSNLVITPSKNRDVSLFNFNAHWDKINQINLSFNNAKALKQLNYYNN
jgi:hypothetical protein